MSRMCGGLLSSLLMLTAAPALAEVKSATADGFAVEHSAQIPLAPLKVYGALGQVGQWWNDEHTFSGKARNLSLQLQAGGCFCERWRDGSVEHGRVLHARNGQILRLQSALGPLQDLALTGILAFTLEPKEGGTTLLLSYRVHGPNTAQLDKLAPVVDGVLADQVARLQKFLQTGKAK